MSGPWRPPEKPSDLETTGGRNGSIVRRPSPLKNGSVAGTQALGEVGGWENYPYPYLDLYPYPYTRGREQTGELGLPAYTAGQMVIAGEERPRGRMGSPYRPLPAKVEVPEKAENKGEESDHDPDPYLSH